MVKRKEKSKLTAGERVSGWAGAPVECELSHRRESVAFKPISLTETVITTRVLSVNDDIGLNLFI